MKSNFKIVFLLCFFFSTGKSISQTTVVFAYDAAGNQVQRNIIIVLNPRLGNPFHEKEEKRDSATVVNFKVFPNPTKDVINIEGDLPEGTESAKIFLFNTTGQILKTDTYSGTEKPINVSDLKAGIYYLEVNYSKKNLATYKIIITN